MNLIINCLCVGAGGFIGSVARYLLGLIPLPNTQSGCAGIASFPFMTFAINIIGSFAIGVIFTLATKNSAFPQQLVLFLKVGLCGGFTTFSSFSLESLQLFSAGHMVAGGLYVVGSVICCLAAIAAGSWIASLITAR